jgi:MAF protein
MSQFSLQLASNSPRRRQLMSWAGWSFTVAAANIDESVREGEEPGPYVLRLAVSKARAVSAAPAGSVSAGELRLLIAADTTVADGKEILGKPADASDAWRMLNQLRGRTHQVYTGLAVFDPSNGRMETDLCRSEVQIRSMTDREIRDYISSGDPFDKAGGYGIQNQIYHPVEFFQGCYANIMGLPLCRLEQLLARFEVYPPDSSGPALSGQAPSRLRCSGSLENDCPVYQRLLQERAEQG